MDETKEQNSIDDYVLKISGKAHIGEPVAIGHNYEVLLKGSVVSITESDNDDGSRTYTYKFMPVVAEIKTGLGKTIKSKDIRRKSQQLRAVLYRLWQEENAPVDFEDYYNEHMEKIITDLIN